MMQHIPQRMCIACRQMQPQNSIIRAVRDNECGKLMLDTDKKRFGRGAYICKNEKCIKLAMKKKALERHLKVAVPTDFYEKLLSLAEVEDEQ